MRKPKTRNGGFHGGPQKIINISLKREKYKISRYKIEDNHLSPKLGLKI